MSLRLVELLLLLLVITPTTVRENQTTKLIEFKVNGDLSIQEKIVREESPAWRISLAFTAASFIPDDRIREQFTVRRHIINKYAMEPSNWGNVKDHFSKMKLVEAVWYNYIMFVRALSRGDYPNATKFYGLLAHYIGDASDPIMAMNSSSEETLSYAEIYESILDNTSADIFAVYSYAYTPESQPSLDVNRTVRELIAVSESFIDTVKNYIDNGDYEALSYTAAEIAEKALNSLISILLRAIKDSGLSDPWRFLYRWSDVIFAIFLATLTAMFVIVIKNLRKRTVPEASVEEEVI